MKDLTQHNKINRKGSVVLVIMDGVGLDKQNEGDALFHANTPNIDKLLKDNLITTLKAHGIAVGLPDDGDMGNSEVGHNAMGAGRIFDQGAKLVSNAINNGNIFKTEAWGEILTASTSDKNSFHLIGLLSDGNVHSHIEHLIKIIEKSFDDGVKNLKVHILLDGRDVLETSALLYIGQLEEVLSKFNSKGCNYAIASGGGRMKTTMDRYEADWSIVQRGWDAHVHGKSRHFKSAKEAIETFRKEDPSITDQYLPDFAIADENGPIGKIINGDAVLFFNFRGDRAIEISRAFDDGDSFDKFDRGNKPEVFYAGIMEYDGDLKIPSNYLVQPPDIDETISEYLVNAGITQFAISETQKFGHVTYFWNGNKSGKFNESTETYVEIPSDKIEFNKKPKMKAAEITDEVIKAIESGEYDFIRLNFANGDMVGHTGDMDAAIIAIETVDASLKRILDTIDKNESVAFITADHGNLDEMYQYDKKTGKPKINEKGNIIKKTSHTLNPVPGIIYDPGFNNEYETANLNDPGIGNIASTLLMLMGFNPPKDYLPSIIKWK